MSQTTQNVADRGGGLNWAGAEWHRMNPGRRDSLTHRTRRPYSFPLRRSGLPQPVHGTSAVGRPESFQGAPAKILAGDFQLIEHLQAAPHLQFAVEALDVAVYGVA